MINSVIVRIVDICANYRWTTIVAGTLLMLIAGAFAAARFLHQYRRRRTDFAKSPLAPASAGMSQAFPQNGISVVVKAPTTENAELATNALAHRLSADQQLFPMVGQPDSGAFFERNGLLFRLSRRGSEERRRTDERASP